MKLPVIVEGLRCHSFHLSGFAVGPFLGLRVSGFVFGALCLGLGFRFWAVLAWVRTDGV